ncbi:HAD family hydrolase [Streptomyces sp. NBC_00199]|uniref:HAD-IIIC family phosphatase n=1 Tax=Streptomyces sp. NBC_00199 TaxID=2975678 RepID=UPI00224EFA09|nr:HAD-IIIC family phosphatase [Streptomyces sp. NBC_00199]MCX5269224.1 HAD-IIIC family phosphatase [Streptomyces sp. NBC_00199]MCX5269766.1 HAD-IIIC family phosphatase [Streptomyces sp. NBC_00199]
MTTPFQRLRELSASGQLARAHPQVAPLLAEITDAGDREPAAVLAELARCGHLLRGLTAPDVLAHHPDTPLVTVAVTGHSTLAQLPDALTAELARHGLLAHLVVGTHGAYLRDLTDPHSELRAPRPDLTLCLLDADAVFDRLGTPWSTDDAETACARLGERVAAIAAAHTATGTGTLVLNTLPLLRRHTQQIIDQRRRALLGALWREFNARLLRLTADHPAVTVVDLDPLIADLGPASDARLALYTRSPFTEQLLSAYAREAAHILRARSGLTKKCLVLDLDDTLWGGVLEEVGADGLGVGDDLLGEPYRRMQRTARQLAAQGVLLAVSSKNDAEPAVQALRDHPDMTLRPDDFVRINANWEPKDANLRDIAHHLGIATDALVFADDSPQERALIRRSLPGTPVVALGGEPALHTEALLRDAWFDTPHVTDDDRRRTARYRQAAARDELRQGAGTYEEYLHDLGIVVHVAPPGPAETARVCQLSLRTNRFNLTGERLRAAELAEMAADPARRVLAVRVRDRFGDSGLVGALLTRDEDDGLYIDNMMLSCRALARGVEDGCLTAVLEHARSRGLPRVRARYRATPANAAARGFYPSLGFTEEPGAGRERWFRHDLGRLPDRPGHLTLEVRLGGTADEHHTPLG